MNKKPKKKQPDQPPAPPPRPRPEAGNQFGPMRGMIAWAAILGVMLLAFNLYTRRQDAEQEIAYNPAFIQYVDEGRVKKVEIIREVTGVTFVRGEILPSTNTIPDPGKIKKGKFRVYVVEADTKLMERLVAKDVEVRVPPQNAYLSQMITSILPVVVIFGVLYFLFMRQMRAAGHGALSFGKSRARLLNREKNKITFQNVGGIDEAKDEVQEIIEFLKDPKKFSRLGGRIPKGVLLMGPPGTGKTLLAKAIAGEADVPFFSISGSDFVEMFVGVGASRVRDMFEQGKKNAPCIIFIDEIDAVGRSRFTGIGGGHDEREQTLNALLVEMDGFETQEGVIIMAATNRPDVLDPALLRPGRFDRRIVIELPTVDGREAILKLHALKIKMGAGADLRRVARGTPGFSGADLENLLNEAALFAARQNKGFVEMKDLEEARDKVLWGRERRSRVMDAKEKRITAVHESGHALVQVVLAEHTDPLHKVTIIPRGLALGATMSLPEKDLLNKTKTQLLADMAVLMGGRSAEEVEFGEISTGARSDLRMATETARHMVCDWGMSEALGAQTFGDNQEVMFLGREITRTQNYSEDTAHRIDEEIHLLLQQGYDTAKRVIAEHRDKLDMIAGLLVEKETLDGRDVMEIVKHGRILPEDERVKIDESLNAAPSTAASPVNAPPPLPA